MPLYRITDGSFRDSDGSTKGPGDTIDLDADMARQHRDKVVLANPPAAPADVQALVQTPAPDAA